MRVIAGTARGMRLAAPAGLRVRPTSDRVRESLFNIIAPHIEGARFLDLFAGTGANGIEALSRGAAFCSFVDKDARSLAVVRGNLEVTRLIAHAHLHRRELPEGLGVMAVGGTPYDIIFADPPYDFDAYDQLLDNVMTTALLASEGIVIIEHATRRNISEETAGLVRTRQAHYGETTLSFFS